jgi:hypothetical protein
VAVPALACRQPALPFNFCHLCAAVGSGTALAATIGQLPGCCKAGPAVRVCAADIARSAVCCLWGSSELLEKCLLTTY